MFGLFRSPDHDDPKLGRFTRSRGRWRGFVTLPGHARVPLVLAGGRREPDPMALAEALGLASDFAGWRPTIEAALREHYRPYAEAGGPDEPSAPPATVPRIEGAGEVWRHALLQYVAVLPLKGAQTVELGFSVAWDEDHTLGARFQQGRLLELNGSVVAP